MITRLLLALLMAPPQAPTTARAGQDSAAALVKQARRAEAHYERVARVRAPITFAWSRGDPCDEIVGRFCLRFDPSERTQPVRREPPEATQARHEAIDALERAARAAPANGFVARGLVRLLVEERRDSAALVAALRFAAASPGAASDLLLGFALHASGDDTAALPRFRRALPDLARREGKRLRIDALLSPAEASRVHRLDPTARAAYEAALWKLADPLYLTPGNEVLAEHLARYVWTRMLAELPRVTGMTSWSRDLDELTLRYGVPTSRERIPAQGIEQRDGMLEHFDPAQLAFLPESLLTVGVRETPPPGEGWTLDAVRSRSGYAPGAVRHMVALPVQLTRFPAGDSLVLRVDGALALDSLGEAASALTARTGLFILPAPQVLLSGDTAVLRAVEAPARVARDTAMLSLQVKLPPGRYVYSAELLEDTHRLAARARYLLELPASGAGPAISDVFMVRPLRGALPTSRDDPVLRPLPEVVAAPGDTLGLYAEASRLTGGPGDRYRVELALGRTRPRPAFARLWGWIRQRLGGEPPVESVRLSWTREIPRERPAGAAARQGRPGSPTTPLAALATDLVVPDLSPGLYTLRLRIIDGVLIATTDRLLRIRRRPKR